MLPRLATDPLNSGGLGAVLGSLLDSSYTLPYAGGSPGLVPAYRGGPVRWHQPEAEAVMAKLGGLAVGLPLPYNQMGRSPGELPASERPSLSRQIVASQYSLTLGGPSQRAPAATGATQPTGAMSQLSATQGGTATQRRAEDRPSLGTLGSQGDSQGDDDPFFQAYVQRIQDSALKASPI